MDRALQANIIAKSGKAVETAGDIDVVLLDKTGTITVGNRHATEFIPVGRYNAIDLGRLAALASAVDETPEGKSIVKLFETQAQTVTLHSIPLATPAAFRTVYRAEPRMSGLDLPSGPAAIRKRRS